MKIGKLETELLKKLVFDKIKFKHEDVITRPGVGEDCAVVDYGEFECVISTDPITAAVNDIGRLAIHVSCNDVASNGVEPLGIMLTVMLPMDIKEEQIAAIMDQAAEEAAAIGVEIIGGHTEITPVVNKPVIVSTAIGKAVKGFSQSAANMKPGDYILMTKYAGLEGTGIIAKDYGERLSGVLSEEDFNEAEEMLKTVSVVKEGILAGRIGTSGMHDVTEGGILGAVWELCEISNTGAEIWVDKIPVKAVTVRICEYFGINFLKLISSGCMIIMTHPEKKDEIMKRLQEEGIPVACIGRVLEAEAGKTLKSFRGSEIGEPIHPPESDELYKVMQ